MKMSKSVNCSYCKSKINLCLRPVECHVCPLGHVLCEYCNDVARTYCFRCGGRTARKIPDKDIKELYRASPNNFMQKIIESQTLVMPAGVEMNLNVEPCADQKQSPTVIGFRKWPRTFFRKVPDVSEQLGISERSFLDRIPKLIEDESPRRKTISKTGWDTFPKSFTDFELSAEVLECPISSCRYPICNSDAMRHLLQTHEDISVLSLPRHVIGEFTLDTKTVRKNEIKCTMRLLVPGVIKDLGITKHKDCLPLYLLYTRVNSTEVEEELSKLNNVRSAVYSLDSEQNPIPNVSEKLDDIAYAAKYPWRKHDCLVIWCAGVVPLDHPITIAITVSPRGDKVMNLGGLVRVFSLHIPQNSHGIFSNTERLIISRHDLKRLTKTSSVIDGQVCIM